jgi:hypothetical protein
VLVVFVVDCIAPSVWLALFEIHVDVVNQIYTRHFSDSTTLSVNHKAVASTKRTWPSLRWFACLLIVCLLVVCPRRVLSVEGCSDGRVAYVAYFGLDGCSGGERYLLTC